MRNDHTPAEKAQIAMGAGFSGLFATRMLFRFADSPALQLAAMAVCLAAAACFCYGVGQLAVSKGRSAAWGFAGFFGYLLVNFVLKPRPVPAPHTGPGYARPRMAPPPPPPPGYVPTR